MLTVMLFAVGLGWFVDRRQQSAQILKSEEKTTRIVDGSKWVVSAKSELMASSDGAIVPGSSQSDLRKIGIVYFLALHQPEVDEYCEIASPEDVDDQCIDSAIVLAARLLLRTECFSFDEFARRCKELDPSGSGLRISGPRQEDLREFVNRALDRVPLEKVMLAEEARAASATVNSGLQ